MATFFVRIWLAEQIGCPPGELSALDRSTDMGFDVIFARAGDPYGQVRLLLTPAGGPSQGRGLVAAWGPGRSASTVVPPGNRVRW